MWVKHQSGNTYNVDDHRQGTKFPPITTAITIVHDPVASAEKETSNNVKGEARRRGRGGKGKTKKRRKRKRKSTKKKRKRKRKRTKKKRRRRRR